MQSYTTQAHQRDYRGNVILPGGKTRARHNKTHLFAILGLMCAITIVGCLCGVLTLHNQQLKHRIKALETQSHATVAPEIPISEQHHVIENLPKLN